MREGAEIRTWSNLLTMIIMNYLYSCLSKSRFYNVLFNFKFIVFKFFEVDFACSDENPSRRHCI